MDDIHLGALIAALIVLLLCSAFFSGSETGLMALNRYRLRHQASHGHKGAQRASRLLQRPDRLIGIILLGNTFVNILASSLATVVAIDLAGEAGVPLAAIGMTVIILIFGEVVPKTIGVLHPERIAYAASSVLSLLLRTFYPLVWLVNGIANGLLRLFRISPHSATAQQGLNPEELRTVVVEAGVMIPPRYQHMLLSILDLEEVTVDDIMVPRQEVAGIDLEDAWEDIVARIASSPYTRLLVYRGDINQVVGFLHLRAVTNRMAQQTGFARADLERLIQEPYFIPQGTSLSQQLVNFQAERWRWGLVVNEYGDLLGLVTLEDILEEIVGEFTTDPSASHRHLIAGEDGSYQVDGSISIRALNRALKWNLPTTGPRTLNGAIMEYLELIPPPGTCLRLGDYPVEIIATANNRVQTVRIWPGRVQANPESAAQ